MDGKSERRRASGRQVRLESDRIQCPARRKIHRAIKPISCTSVIWVLLPFSLLLSQRISLVGLTRRWAIWRRLKILVIVL